MTAQRAPSSTSRRSHERIHAEFPIGRYLRLDEIGRGSFATVYQGVHSVGRFILFSNIRLLTGAGVSLRFKMSIGLLSPICLCPEFSPS